MITLYMIILCFSTTCVAWAGLRVAQQIASLSGHRSIFAPAGTAALLATIAFLIVANAPGPILLGALLLLATAALPLLPAGRRLSNVASPLVAAALGVMGLAFPSIPTLPAPALMAAAGILWLAVTLAGRHSPATPTASLWAATLTCLPLIASPLLSASPCHIALDSALILAGLLGVTASAGTSPARLGAAHTALSYLLGWLMLETALRGAWLPALISALAWASAIAYATLHKPEIPRA